MNAPLAQPLSRYAAMALGVDTRAPKAARGLEGSSPTGEVDAPAFQVPATFNYQSYFDNTLLNTAILAAPSNEPIIPSTRLKQTVGGYAIGLHPSSECPVAVKLATGAQQGASQTFRLKPGDVIRPQGTKTGKPASFGGFEWGLPFGWLGGGSAMLVVMRTPDANVFWTGNPEVIFHRQRMQIYALASAPLPAAVPYNWPKRFPWPRAVFGANNVIQSGQPALAVTPTRVEMRLRLEALAAPADVRVGFVGTNDFAWGTAGAPTTLNDVAFVDMTWGSYVASIANTNPGAWYPVQELSAQYARLACDNGGVIMVDISGAQDLAEEYVDVVRYGTL